MRQVIGIGSVANDGTGDTLRSAYTKTNANVAELYDRAANATDVFGAAPDGSTSVNAAISAAITAGVKTLIFDEGSSFYRMTASIVMPSGFSIVAGRGRPTLKMDNGSLSRAFLLTGVSDAHVIGVTVDGNKSVTPSDAIAVLSGGCTNCSIENTNFINCPSATTGTVVLSGTTTNRNTIRNCKFDDCEGTAIGLSGGSENSIVNNDLRNSGSFGIHLLGSAARNLISGNRSITSVLESIALDYTCSLNRIIGNHCESASDNGISISGPRNTVVGNVCYANGKAGIGVWGSENVIANNILERNNFGNTTNYWSGVWIHADYGGTGSFNTITGNMADDDQDVPTQNYGINIHGIGYIVWAAGQTSIVSGSTWRRYGLNIYLAASSGTTGATPPTHTSGTVSDGTINWTWINAFTTAAAPLWNHVADNIVRRSAIASYKDVDNWQRNVLFSSTTTSMLITADGLVRARPL